MGETVAALGLAQYSHYALLLLVLAAFVAGLARGFSGFGSALIFMPLASTVIPPQVAAPLFLIVDFVLSIGMIPRAWPVANKHYAFTMAFGALVGAPIGAWFLTQMSPVIIRWMVVLLIFPMLALLMGGWRYHGKPLPIVTAAVGSIGGFFNGAAQVGGPPVVLYWLGSATRGEVVRANIVVFFALSSLISGTAYAVSGLFTTSLLGLSVLIAPTFAAGLYLGSHMFWIAREETFRRICYLLIACAGLLSLPALDGVIR